MARHQMCSSQELIKSSTENEEFDFMISIIKRYIDDIFMIWPYSIVVYNPVLTATTALI